MGKSLENEAWEPIHGFVSPREYIRFVEYIDGLVRAGDVEEVIVDPDYGPGEIYGGRWFVRKQCKDVWRLVAPDFPFRGLWERLPHGYSA